MTHSATGIPVYTKNLLINTEMKETERDYFADQIRHLNGGDFTDSIILYPGVEYYLVAAVDQDDRNNATGIFPQLDCYGRDYYRSYLKGFESVRFEWVSEEHPQPFYLQKWEDIQSDPALLDYFTRAEEALRYTVASYPVTLTDDIGGTLPFHLGVALLEQGRFITEEEYQTGARVCMISRQLALRKNWSVGDRLDLNFYRFDAYPSYDVQQFVEQPIYNKTVEGIFDRGTYTVVGIYDTRDLPGNSTISKSSVALPWLNLYVPKRSVALPADESALPVHGNLLTIRLKNGAVNAFLDDLTAKGLTEPDRENCTPKFTFFDQGYSLVQPGLEAMQGTAKLLLGLSAALLLATVILLAYFFAQSQKYSVGILRILGGSKASAFTAVLVCALLLTAAGAAAGGLLGHTLSNGVGGKILSDNLQQSREAAEFSAYLLAGGQPELELSAAADPLDSLIAAGGAAAFFLLLTAVFTLAYLSKEPRALLPEKD